MDAGSRMMDDGALPGILFALPGILLKMQSEGGRRRRHPRGQSGAISLAAAYRTPGTRNARHTLDYVQRILSPAFRKSTATGCSATIRPSSCGMGQLDGRHVLLVGEQKGRDTKQRLYRNFGMPKPEGYRKALRVMQMAAKFGRPIITFLDTPGAYPGLDAEERGQGEAIARNLREMARLPVPVISVCIGRRRQRRRPGARCRKPRLYAGKRRVQRDLSGKAALRSSGGTQPRADQAAAALRMTAEDFAATEADRWHYSRAGGRPLMKITTKRRGC